MLWYSKMKHKTFCISNAMQHQLCLLKLQSDTIFRANFLDLGHNALF